VAERLFQDPACQGFFGEQTHQPINPSIHQSSIRPFIHPSIYPVIHLTNQTDDRFRGRRCYMRKCRRNVSSGCTSLQ
jgi:hypothetical protein